jgi:hypothetical protein
MKKIGNLTGLAWALAELAEQPQQADEFTAAEFAAGGGATTHAAAHNTLSRMRKAGKIESRMITIDGYRTRVYRRA